MRLQRLTSLEIDKVVEEFNELQKLIKKLNEILVEKNIQDTIIKEELNYLNPYFDVLPKEIFTEEYTNPVTDGSGYMRMQLQEASKLLEESGWELVDGKLLHSSTKEPFEFEILLRSPAFERIVFPFKDNLEKLGIIAEVRTIDSAQYQKRMETFDFDMVVQTFGQSFSPGNEQRNFWGSDAADTDGSRNVVGIKN